jgi:hypothetical protein
MMISRCLSTPSWADPLLADAETIARLVFVHSENVSRVLTVLRQSVSTVGQLPTCDPNHWQWLRIAIVIKLLVCSAFDLGIGLESKAALQRLASFVDENEDLLTVSTASLDGISLTSQIPVRR